MAAARLSMKALHPTRTDLSGPWSLRLGETGPLADILFQRVGCLQGKQPAAAAPTAGYVCVCVSCAQVCPQLNVALSDCLCVYVRVTELNYRCRELAPRSRLDGILCDFCRKLISLRLALSHAHTSKHTDTCTLTEATGDYTSMYECNWQCSRAHPLLSAPRCIYV